MPIAKRRMESRQAAAVEPDHMGLWVEIRAQFLALVDIGRSCGK